MSGNSFFCGKLLQSGNLAVTYENTLFLIYISKLYVKSVEIVAIMVLLYFTFHFSLFA